ncbi:MAG TPA: hypothetical protein VFU76_05050 [Terriglobales bacterium]|nr:hypothetical protein [Terriglobales bacterium]
MAATTLHKAMETGESVAETLHQASRENLAAARRTMRTVGKTLKHGYEAAYDAVEETTHLVKRHPWPALGMVFGAAFTLGVLAGWKIGKKL